jgi:hypothetical protein
LILEEKISLALASRGLRHGVLTGVADVGKMGVHASLNSPAAWLYVRTDFFNIGPTRFSDRRSFNEHSLARRREITYMGLDASPDTTLARRHARAQRLDIPGALLRNRLLCHRACYRKQDNGADRKGML